MINHVTYEVPKGALDAQSGHVSNCDAFFDQIGFRPVDADPEVEAGYSVLWYQDPSGFQVHLVETEEYLSAGDIEEVLNRGLEHFAVEVPPEKYEQLKGSSWRLRIGSGRKRIWLEGPFRLRVEVRPAASGALISERPEGEVGSSYSDHLHAFSVSTTTGGIQLVGAAKNPSVIAQADVLIKALGVYQERNADYKDNWRRFGLRGCLFRIRERAERAWDRLWNLSAYSEEDRDDLVDLINFAAFACRAMEEGNRDGSWWTDED